MNQPDILKVACMGNQSAISFLETIGTITQIWDDLIDKDKPLSDYEINEAFIGCLIDLPRNAFYRENFLDLQPVIEHVIIQWVASAKIEKSGDHELLPITFVTRGAFNDLITRCAMIIGGWDHASKMAVAVADFTHYDEKYSEYENEIRSKGVE